MTTTYTHITWNVKEDKTAPLVVTITRNGKSKKFTTPATLKALRRMAQEMHTDAVTLMEGLADGRIYEYVETAKTD